MSELLTAKDVEVKVFKKVRFGGYSIPEVEDFLNQIADDLEAYAIQIEEKDARIQELESYAKKREAMTDDIKDALILARKAAKEVEDQAKSSREKILSEAHSEAEKIISDAKAQVQAKINDAETQANDVLLRAKASADEIAQSTQDRREKADKSLANIEQELEMRRREAEDNAENILSAARTEAQKLISDAEKEVADYESQLKFLNLKKQQFLKDTMALLLHFGKTVDEAQQEIDIELQEENASEKNHETYSSAKEPENDFPENADGEEA